MTHEYTLLIGGTVMRGGSLPDATAIAWAADTVLAIGTDEEVRAISRGDSRTVDLGGRTVIPLGDHDATWPTSVSLEVGGPANLAVLDADPRAGPFRPSALVRSGRVVIGALPGADEHGAT